MQYRVEMLVKVPDDTKYFVEFLRDTVALAGGKILECEIKLEKETD